MKIEKYNQKNKRKYTLITLGLLSVIGICLVIGSSFAKFSENQSFKIVEGNIDYYGDADVIFTYYDQNSEELDTMPTKESNLVFDYGNCDNEEEVTWDDDSWGPVISNITNSKTRCNIYFKEGESILRQISHWPDDTQGMWGHKDKITKLVLENSLTSKTGTVVYGPFDESSENNDGIQSYVVCDEGDTNCVGYLQGNEKIKLNSRSSNLFYNFSKVTTIEGIENLDTSSVKYMDYMFSNMNSLQLLDLSKYNFDTSSVTSMEDMFEGMSALVELNLGDNFDTSSVTDMANMFSGLKSLTFLNLGNSFNTSSVRNMHMMFSGMSAIQELNLGSNFDTSNVWSMSCMFQNMSSLENLDLSQYNFDTSSVTDMGSMFNGMESLQSLNLGSLFNTSQVTDMNHMFADMKALKNLDLSKYNFDTSNVKNMMSMFFRMSSLQNLNLGSKFNTSKVTNMWGMFEMLPLQFLNLGSLFDTSKVTDMSGMFSWMSSLQSLSLGSKFNTSQVTTMNGMFEYDSKLKIISYGSNFIHKSGANTFNMFNNCPANHPTHSSWNGVTF